MVGASDASGLWSGPSIAMGRCPIGDKPLTQAQRQALLRQRKAEQYEQWRQALEDILEAKTVREARALAAKALEQ